MAREMYLVGVPKEDLQPSAPLPPPQTPRGKWENFWYHYKWAVIVGVFFLIAGIILVGQMLSRPQYDYHMVVVTDYAMSDVEIAQLKVGLEKHGQDVDEDGTVSVNVENLVISNDVRLLQVTRLNQAKMSGYLASGELVLYAFSPSYYKTLHEGLAPEGVDPQKFHFFSPLAAYGNAKEDTVWDWENAKILQEESMKDAPKHLYFGVRALTGTAEDSGEQHAQAVELLQKFIEYNTVAE